MLVMVMTYSSSYASFPVQRTVTSADTSVMTTVADEEKTPVSPAATSAASKQMSTALLLWFFLGGFAGHRWYLGSPVGWNILFILTFGGLGIWWIIDGIDIMTEKYPGL